MPWLSLSSQLPGSLTQGKVRQRNRCLIIAKRSDDPSPDIVRSLTDRLCPPYDIIAVNGGYRLATFLGLKPDTIIGDMDSCSPTDQKHMQESGCLTELHPAMKDETDSHLALSHALRSGYTDITIMFDHKGRFDHVLSLVWVASAFTATAHIRLIDVDLEVAILSGPATIHIHKPHLITSLLPITPTVTDITTTNMKYSLTSGTISWGQSIGISNETLTDQAQIQFAAGTLLVITTDNPD